MAVGLSKYGNLFRKNKLPSLAKLVCEIRPKSLRRKTKLYVQRFVGEFIAKCIPGSWLFSDQCSRIAAGMLKFGGTRWIWLFRAVFSSFAVVGTTNIERVQVSTCRGENRYFKMFINTQTCCRLDGPEKIKYKSWILMKSFSTEIIFSFQVYTYSSFKGPLFQLLARSLILLIRLKGILIFVKLCDEG